MRGLKKLCRQILFLFRTAELDQRLEEEMRLHVEMRTRENVEAGMSSEEARFAALRRFGNALMKQEESREVWIFTWLETLAHDLRYGWRQLGRSPGFTAVIVLTLALGVGANTAIFSLIDAVMLKMLPVKNPGQLTLLNWAAQGSPGIMPASDIIHSLSGTSDQDQTGRLTSTSFSYPTFEQIRARNDVFSSVFAFADPDFVNLNVNGQAAMASGELVSGDYFSGLGPGTAVGRTITARDDKPGAPAVAMISYGYWERRFGREASVVGKAITINDVPFTIIGVTPPEFFGLQPGRSLDVWLPLHTQPQVEPSWSEEGRSKFIRTDDWWVVIMGRLKPGVSEQQARASLEVAFQQSMAAQEEAARKTGPRESPKSGARAEAQDLPHLDLAPASKGLNELRQEFSKPLFILMAVVGLVLLIACANVANLLLSRATTRHKEIAVRLAIGAGRRRLIRQLLTESVLLAALGGIVGLVLAYWATSLLVAFMSSGREPVALSVHPDLRVLGFTAAVSVLTGVLFGLAPAFRSTRLDLTPALKESAGVGSTGAHRGGRSGLGKMLVVAQVAMSLLLLVGAGLFVRTLQNLESLNTGFNRNNILLFGIDPTQNGYKGERLASFYQQLQQRLEALPGVRSASTSRHTLIGGGITITGIFVQGYTVKAGGASSQGAENAVYANAVGPRFFETMGIPVLLGRLISREDTSAAPKVAVINETLAHKYFANSSPIGRRFGFGDAKSSGDVEIVGVVADARYADLRQEIPPTVYVPYLQQPEQLGGMFFEVRTAGNPMNMVASVRRVVESLDKNLPLMEVKTQTEQIDQTLFQERLFAKLSSFFGLLALVLACVGLYGIMAYSVVRRTNEIGIRMALGAERRDILGMVMRETLVMVTLGVVIGILAALAATRLVSSMLYGLKATDPWTIAIAALVMIAVAALAGYLPARRASLVDPMVALRYE